jgi:hypothetical protein
MRVSIGLGAFVASLLMVGGGRARADEHVAGMRDSQLTASLMGGVGAQLGDRADGALGAVMGLRAGYTIDEHFYFGAQALLLGDRFDASMMSAGDGTSGSETRVTSGFAAGLEVGYAQPLGPVILRPSLVLGLGVLGYASAGAGDPILDVTGPRFGPALYVAPGASLLVPIGEFFAGVDPRFVYMLGEQSHSAASLMAMLGLIL